MKTIGFRTQGHNRGLLFSTWAELLELDNFVPSEHVLKETLNMIVDEDERVDHMPDRNDDHLFAAMIALTVAKMNPAPRYERWDNYRENYKGPGIDMGWN